jgi:HPt (histidine-containing phosphotransfer) domain-containing protein
MPRDEDFSRIDLAALDPDRVFPDRLANDRAILIEYFLALDALGMDARERNLKQIATLAHRLGGAAGTFGFSAVSDAALALEERIVDRQPGENSSVQHEAIRQSIDALVRALDDALSNLSR